MNVPLQVSPHEKRNLRSQSLKTAHQQRVDITIRKMACADADGQETEAGSARSCGCILSSRIRPPWTTVGLANPISRVTFSELLHRLPFTAAIMVSVHWSLFENSLALLCTLS